MLNIPYIILLLIQISIDFITSIYLIIIMLRLSIKL
jgi:hypothetical protein